MSRDRPATSSTRPGAAAPAPADYLAVFLVSLAFLLFQISLMRVLSVVIWYHFAFLTLSLVMLGMSLPGIWLGLLKNPFVWIPRFLLLSAIAFPVSTALMTRFGADLLAGSVLWVILAILPAMIFPGGAVCLLLMRAQGPAISRMYGADLLGGCLGAGLVVPLLSLVPTPHLAAGCGLLPLLALLGYGKKGSWSAAGLGTAILAGLVWGTPFEVRKSKDYDEQQVRPIHEVWTPNARITVFEESFGFLKGQESGFTWGRGRYYPKDRKVRQYWVEQDGSAGTPITEWNGDTGALDFLRYDVTSVGYELRPPRKVAVIGAGGGRDILSALGAGAQEIDAVELNSTLIDIVSRKYGALSGDVYHAPGVRAIAGEGRSFLTRNRDAYDLIQISLTDTWAATLAGTFTLAENNLYTVEAFQLYLDRLTPGGMLSVSRWTKEMPWLVELARTALGEAGIPDPEKHLMIVTGGRLGTLLISRKAVSLEEERLLLEIAAERGFSILYPVPRGRRPVDPFMVQTVEQGLAPLAELGAKVAPPVDDRPYFFNVISPFTDPERAASRIREATGFLVVRRPVEVLRRTIIFTGALALMLLIAGPAWMLRRRHPGSPAALIRGSLYFAAIGAGFMFLENVLIQRLVLYLDHPAYAVPAVLAPLLLGMGGGSLSAARFGVSRLQHWGFLAPVILLLLTLGLPAGITATLGAPLAGRVFLTASCLLPVGYLLGFFFPLGMLRFGDGWKPWFWAVNGFFGVLAGVASLALSMEVGFQMVGMVGALAYLLAWIGFLGRPSGAVLG